MGFLVTADQLAASLDAGERLTVLDARHHLTHPGRGHEEYLEGHVPGAVFLDVDADLSAHPAAGADGRAGSGGRHPLPDAAAFGAAMRRLGVCHDVPVVVYDQATSLSAGRARWMLRDAGHPDVRILDGGWQAWTRAGGRVEVGEVTASAGDFVPAPGQLPRVTADDIPALLAAGHRLHDVRAPQRYRGETEPIDPVAGHIPGARNLPATGFLADDGTFLPVERLREAASAVRPGDAVSCGSGITAAQVLMALELAGIEGVALYAGSWSDWISDPARPVAIGDES